MIERSNPTENVLPVLTPCPQCFNFKSAGNPAGGHAKALLGSHPEVHQFWGLDIDPEAHDIARARLQLAKDSNGWRCQLNFSGRNYSEIRKAIQAENTETAADAILLDLGVSSMQVDNATHLQFPPCCLFIIVFSDIRPEAQCRRRLTS